MNISININTTASAKGTDKDTNKLTLSTAEIILNSFFGIILLLSSIIYLLNPLTIPLIIIYCIFAIYLLSRKRYSITANTIFLFLALGVYFIPTPFGTGLYHNIKELRVSGYNFTIFKILFLIAPLTFVAFSLKNLLCNLLAYLKVSLLLRTFLSIFFLIIVLCTIIAYPLLDRIRLLNRTMGVGGNGDLFATTIEQTAKNPESDFTSHYDKQTKKYIYRLKFLIPLSKSINFVTVKIDGEKVNFRTDTRIKCTNCLMGQNDVYALTFPIGKTIDFIVESDQLIKTIGFIEPGEKVADFSFWE